MEEKRAFNGIIRAVRYGDKKTPIVTINGQTYAIGFSNEDFKNLIGQGDSLIKIKDSRVYKLVKHQTGRVIFSE